MSNNIPYIVINVSFAHKHIYQCPRKPNPIDYFDDLITSLSGYPHTQLVRQSGPIIIIRVALKANKNTQRHIIAWHSFFLHRSQFYSDCHIKYLPRGHAAWRSIDTRFLVCSVKEIQYHFFAWPCGWTVKHTWPLTVYVPFLGVKRSPFEKSVLNSTHSIRATTGVFVWWQWRDFITCTIIECDNAQVLGYQLS